MSCFFLKKKLLWSNLKTNMPKLISVNDYVELQKKEIEKIKKANSEIAKLEKNFEEIKSTLELHNLEQQINQI